MFIYRNLSYLFKAVVCINVLLFCVACGDSQQDGRYIGYVEAEWVYIAAPQAGLVIVSRANEGQLVNNGQILFELDASQQLAALAEASGKANQAAALTEDLNLGPRASEINALQARLDQARARHQQLANEDKRITPLVEQGIESKARGEKLAAELAIAEADVIAAEQAIITAQAAGRDQQKVAALSAQQASQARLEIVKQQLAERTIKASIPGRIQQLFYNTGEYATAGSPMAAILPSGGLRVRFFVPQSNLSQLRIGQAISVSSDGSDSPLSASINYIADTAEYTPPIIYSKQSRQKLVFMVEATLPNETNLHPGLPVDIQI